MDSRLQGMECINRISAMSSIPTLFILRCLHSPLFFSQSGNGISENEAIEFLEEMIGLTPFHFG